MDDADYGNDLGGFGVDDIAGDTDLQGDHSDEKALLSAFETAVKGSLQDYKAVLEQTVKQIGKSTIAKIVNAKKESGSDHFSRAEKEALLGLFH